jgi:hypothetical protein
MSAPDKHAISAPGGEPGALSAAHTRALPPDVQRLLLAAHRVGAAGQRKPRAATATRLARGFTDDDYAAMARAANVLLSRSPGHRRVRRDRKRP